MKTAFRSHRKAVLTAWEEYRERTEQVMAARLRFAESFGKETGFVRRDGWGSDTRMVGLPGTETEVPPDGWRWSPQEGHLVPNLRTRLGRDIRVEMSLLGLEGPRLPGMPQSILRVTAIYSPALFRHDGAIYAGWDTEPQTTEKGEEPHADKVDLGLWRTIPLSVFYEAREALEAEKVLDEKRQAKKAAVKA